MLPCRLDSASRDLDTRRGDAVGREQVDVVAAAAALDLSVLWRKPPEGRRGYGNQSALVVRLVQIELVRALREEVDEGWV